MVAVRFEDWDEFGQQLVATVRALMIGFHGRPCYYPAKFIFIEYPGPDLLGLALEHPIRMRNQPTIQRVIRIAPFESRAEKGCHQVPPRLCLGPGRGWVVAAIPARRQHGLRDDDVKF